MDMGFVDLFEEMSSVEDPFDELSSIDIICKNTKHPEQVLELLNRPCVTIAQQIIDICKYYEYLMENQPTPEQEKEFVDSLVNKFIHDQKEQNNDQN